MMKFLIFGTMFACGMATGAWLEKIYSPQVFVKETVIESGGYAATLVTKGYRDIRGDPVITDISSRP